ncbi:MAG: spore maturation protein [Bacteroidetes bacterium]|nr:spore maturation protein [Bacteroidota bacterium]
MALSRIWSYMILFAIAVAAYRYVQGDKNIFNDMVTEKKLQEGETFQQVNYYMPDTALTLSATAKQLQQANWKVSENFSKAQFILVPSSAENTFREQLSQKLSAIKIIQLKDLESQVNSSQLVYTEDEYHGNLKTTHNLLHADVIATNAQNTDSLRQNWIAISQQQKVVEVTKVNLWLPKNIDGIFETGKFAVNIAIGLIGTLALFMGLLNIAERAGGISVISRIISPFLSKLFPSLPKDHSSFGHMVMNFSANMLGLDNAATPFGLKAMQSLQEINPDKDRASDAQIMFLALHAAGLTLIPVSIIAVRAANGSHNPNEIFIPLMLTTFVCTLTALILTSLKQKINLLQPKLILPLFGLSAGVALFVWFLHSLQPHALNTFSDAFSNGAILVVFLAIIAGGLYKKIDLFDAFVDGAKGGFETAVRIIPYMVGMLVAVCMLRTSGAFDIVINPVKHLIAASGMDTRWAEGLPTALLRPFSAGGARGFMIDAMRTFGPDSFIGKLCSVLQGSSETTFYVVALYFGSVSIKDTRYSIPVMLMADLAGVIFSILICYVLWG